MAILETRPLPEDFPPAGAVEFIVTASDVVAANSTAVLTQSEPLVMPTGARGRISAVINQGDANPAHTEFTAASIAVLRDGNPIPGYTDVRYNCNILAISQLIQTYIRLETGQRVTVRATNPTGAPVYASVTLRGWWWYVALTDGEFR